MFKMFAFAGLLAFSGCASTERIQLSASADQEQIVRDGIPALISKKRHFVMLRPSGRSVKSTGRPSFTVVIRNLGTTPETLREADITAFTVLQNRQVALARLRYDDLVREEQQRQTVQAVAVALSAAGNAMAAANAGYQTTTGSIYTSRGGYGTYTETTYNSHRAQQARSFAQAQTAADVAAMQAEGERNLSLLEASILKDNTVMPGEWHGGTIVLEAPPRSDTGTLSYTVTVRFGGDTHDFRVSQVPI